MTKNWIIIALDFIFGRDWTTIDSVSGTWIVTRPLSGYGTSSRQYQCFYEIQYSKLRDRYRIREWI